MEEQRFEAEMAAAFEAERIEQEQHAPTSLGQRGMSDMRSRLPE
jgi:hypothetical protein